MNAAVNSPEIKAIAIECAVPEGAADAVILTGSLVESAASYKVITTQEGLDRGSECLARLREIGSSLEKKRAAMKKPSLDAGRMVDDLFKPYQDRIAQAINDVNGGVTAYMKAEKKRLEDEERARRAEEQRKLEAEAAERRKQEQAQREAAAQSQRQAQAKLDEAAALEAQGDEKGAQAALEAASAADEQAQVANTQAEQSAQEAAGVAQAAEAVVAAPVNVEMRTTGTLGSKAKLKPVMNYRIMDISKVPEQYLVPPEERLIKALVRATMNSKVPIPGIEYFEEFTTATRTSRV